MQRPQVGAHPRRSGATLKASESIYTWSYIVQLATTSLHMILLNGYFKSDMLQIMYMD